MKYMNFTMKLISFLVILGVLYYYQGIALQRAEQVEQREQEIAEVEAYNSEILEKQSLRELDQLLENTEESQVTYQDGIYPGLGSGKGGNITVSVTVENGKVSAISVLSHDGEDEEHYAQAEAVLARMVANGNAEADTISGATLSSRGLIEAVANALEKAKEQSYE